MLPILEKVAVNINHSFNVSYLKAENLPSPLHFHPEVEILFVIQGTGTRFIGDSVERFAPGDLIMIGSNVPHVWYSDQMLPEQQDKAIPEVIYILFNPGVFGEQFWNLQESKSIISTIKHSQRGIKLAGRNRNDVAKMMTEISEAAGFKRIRILLDILEKIASCEDYKYLASPIFQNNIKQTDSGKLTKVYEYVINNWSQEISLTEAASLANLSKTAFCRYFKQRVNKTFVQFLTEIRIGHACQILVQENHSVTDICFICGFKNTSYFIKQFKTITGLTPLDYRKRNQHQIDGIS